MKCDMRNFFLAGLAALSFACVIVYLDRLIESLDGITAEIRLQTAQQTYLAEQFRRGRFRLPEHGSE